MIVEYRPIEPPNDRGFRGYADSTSEAGVDDTAPHVGTDLLNGEPVEVYWWARMHGWFEKDSKFIFCRCKSCVEAVRG